MVGMVWLGNEENGGRSLGKEMMMERKREEWGVGHAQRTVSMDICMDGDGVGLRSEVQAPTLELFIVCESCDVKEPANQSVTPLLRLAPVEVDRITEQAPLGTFCSGLMERRRRCI